MLVKIKNYFQDVRNEYKSIEFPKKDDVVKTSISIGLIVFFTSCLVWLTDFSISYIIKIIFGI